MWLNWPSHKLDAFAERIAIFIDWIDISDNSTKYSDSEQ